MGEDTVKEKDNRHRQRIFTILTYVVAIVCMWAVLRHAHWQDFRSDVREIGWGWVVLAVISNICAYLCQGWRWTMLLTPIERIPVIRSVQSVFVGVLATGCGMTWMAFTLALRTDPRSAPTAPANLSHNSG